MTVFVDDFTVEEGFSIVPQRFVTYLCRIKLRETFNGSPLKERVRELDGREFNLYYAYDFEEGERYFGEFAMVPSPSDPSYAGFPSAGIHWIASGDVEILGEADQWRALGVVGKFDEPSGDENFYTRWFGDGK